MEVIYALEDPTNGLVKYVGRAKDVYSRFIQHLRCNGNNIEKNNWIISLRERGIVPVCRTLEVVYESNVQEREWYWINHYLSLGVPLLNIAIVEYVENKVRCTSEGKLGRGRTEQGVKEIFDTWFTTGEFPDFVSGRMKRYYKQHYIRRDGKLHWKFLNMHSGFKKARVK